jgi:FkbM family methyltransferase
MTYQRILLRLLSSNLPGRSWRRFLRRRIWTIEDGEGAGLKLNFSQNSDYILGSSESPVQKALGKQFHPGDVFYDIGANVGFFSLIAAKGVGPTGCVYSFEPVSENVVSIRQNAKVNQLENIRPFEVAVGRISGNEELLLTEWNGGATLSSSVVKTSEPVSIRNVRVVALDDFIQEEKLRTPTLVKIDVEGSELDVVQGMSRTVAKSKPVLLYEIDDGRRDAFRIRWQELDQYVAGFGYKILHLEESYPGINWNVGHSLALPL